MPTKIRMQSGWVYEVEEPVDEVNRMLRENEYVKFEESPGGGRSTVEIRAADVGTVEEMK